MQTPDILAKDHWSEPRVLDGRKLRLEPLGVEHLEDLERNLLTQHAWHSAHWGLVTREDLEKGIQRSVLARKERTGNSFAFVVKSTGEAVGMSRLMEFSRKNNSLEIGGTWIGTHWQKSFVNTEAKFLMLTNVFETIKCQRVEFRVDSMNFNSQRAVLRIGAKFEGELRSCYLLPDGRRRDYKVYSILESEWFNVKTTLNWYLEKYV